MQLDAPITLIRGGYSTVTGSQYRDRFGASAITLKAITRAALVLGAMLVLGACEGDAIEEPAPPEASSAPTGKLEITYPLDETLFPSDIVAPTFLWSDEAEGAGHWV
jgi:hypothetical protein